MHGQQCERDKTETSFSDRTHCFSCTKRISAALPYCGELNINGQDLIPMLSAPGQATSMNESDGAVAAVTCEKFDGILEGVGRVQRLYRGSCILFSGKNSNLLIGWAD